MVSVADLLNPEPPRAPLPTCRPPPLTPDTRTMAFRPEAGPPRRPTEGPSMAEDTKTPPRCKARGFVNFPPFEDLDEATFREVRRFRVHPLGSIRNTCERIPYNSGKKDFYLKTGREGFEAFHYDFKIPGGDTSFTVMWDYSVGLVRMTSFFKCCGYSKTTPAKMLNLNPGLKDITYSITGGSIKAQGYWMPYSCAKAICATFCHKISPALIPIFGPRFPSECIPETAPDYGRMIINPELVARAKSEAAMLLRTPAALPSPRSSRSASPLPSQRQGRAHDLYERRSDRRLLMSPYTDTEIDYPPPRDPYARRGYPPALPIQIPTSRPSFGPAAVPTPLHSPGWTAVNHPQVLARPALRGHPAHLREDFAALNVSETANPWLSAVPRTPPPAGGGASKWPHPHHPHHPHHPRSHNPHPHHYPSSPVCGPERGPTLAPLRFKKRPFDEVDSTEGTTGVRADDRNKTNINTRHPVHENNNTHNGPGTPRTTTTRHASPSPSPGPGPGPSAAPNPTHNNPAAHTAPSTPDISRTVRAPPPTPSPAHDGRPASPALAASTRIPAAAAADANANANATAGAILGPAAAAAAAAIRASERDAAFLLLGLRQRGAGVPEDDNDDDDDHDDDGGRDGGDEGCQGGGGGGLVDGEKKRKRYTRVTVKGMVEGEGEFDGLSAAAAGWGVLGRGVGVDYGRAGGRVKHRDEREDGGEGRDEKTEGSGPEGNGDRAGLSACRGAGSETKDRGTDVDAGMRKREGNRAAMSSADFGSIVVAVDAGGRGASRTRTKRRRTSER